MERVATTDEQTTEEPRNHFAQAVHSLLNRFKDEGRAQLKLVCNELSIMPTAEALIGHHAEIMSKRKRGRLMERVSAAIQSARANVEFRMRHPDYVEGEE